MESGRVRHSGGTATSQRVDSPRTPLLCGWSCSCLLGVIPSPTFPLLIAFHLLLLHLGRMWERTRSRRSGMLWGARAHTHTHEDALRAPGARGAKERGVGRVGVGRSGRGQRPSRKWETRGYGGGERSPPPPVRCQRPGGRAPSLPPGAGTPACSPQHPWPSPTRARVQAASRGHGLFCHRGAAAPALKARLPLEPTSCCGSGCVRQQKRRPAAL